MTERSYTLAYSSDKKDKNGAHFKELICMSEDKRIIRLLLPVSNTCDYMPFRDIKECLDCDYCETCKLEAPCDIDMSRKLVIVSEGETIQDFNPFDKRYYNI